MSHTNDMTQAQNAPKLHITQLNSVRLFIILAIGLGYASTMPLGPGNQEMGAHWGYDPSWYGMQIIFFLSGLMAMRSISAGRTGWAYLMSRAKRTIPLLALYTAAVVVLLYPLLCAPAARTASSIPVLAKYFIETVFLTNPGQPLPGLMDDAKYGCLAQGAIWTLRWGAAIHIGVAIGSVLGLFKNKLLLLAAAIFSTIAYGVIQYYALVNQITALEPLMPGFKFGYAFLFGMAVFAWRDKLPLRRTVRALWLTALGAAAMIFYNLMPWTPAGEITGTLFWGYLTLLGLQIYLPALRQWPNLVLPTFLAIWPSAQLYLLAMPEISPTGLIFASLTTSLGLAYLIRLAGGNLKTRLRLGRKVAVKPA